METVKTEVKETVETLPQLLETEKKREVISVQVTPEEKRKITVMAVKDCGISVSEFIRTRAFMDIKAITSNTEEPMPLIDEEREIYEVKITELNAENLKLKTDIVNLKVTNAKPSNTEIEVIKPEVYEGSLNIVFEPKMNTLFDRIKSFRNDKLKTLTEEEQLTFLPFDKYVKVLLMRGLKRSYYGSVLNSHTGLTTDDIRDMAEAENINYEEQI